MKDYNTRYLLSADKSNLKDTSDLMFKQIKSLSLKASQIQQKKRML